jgi:hypothetical protein
MTITSFQVWKDIKNLVRTKSQKYHAPTNINDNGLELNDPKSIANAFNTFFSTIGSNLASKVPYVHKLHYTLFLIYINDFGSCSKMLDFHLFADDANFILFWVLRVTEY